MAESDVTERIRILLEAQTEAADKAMRKSAREITRLEKQYDPLSRAAVRLKNAEDQLARGLDQGTLSADRHAKLLAEARAEYARTEKAVLATRGALASSGAQVKGLSGVMSRHKGALQQAGYQFGDFAVQVGSGQNAMIAFAQQGSQLLGVFGAWGAIAGAALAVGAPLIASFMGGADAAEGMADQLDKLSKAVDTYKTAASDAQVDPAELLRDFGPQAEAMQELLNIQRQLAEIDAAQALQETADALAAVADVGMWDVLAGYVSDSAGAVRKLRDEFDLTNVQATTLYEAFQAISEADTPAAQAEAMRMLREQLELALGPVTGMTEEGRRIYDALVNAEKAALRLGAADVSANITTGADEAGRLGNNLDFAARQAAKLDAVQRRLRQEGKVYSGRGGDPRTSNQQGYGEFVYEGPQLDADNNPIIRKSRSGGGGGKSKEEFDPLAAGQEQITELERQIETLGMAADKVAALEAKWKLLEAAKQKGIDLDKVQAETGRTVREEIEAQAGSIGKLTEQYERAEERTKFFESAQQDLKSGMIDAIVEGESFAGVLENLAKKLAKAALQAALFGEGPFAGGGSGGGSGGGLFGALGAAIIDSFDGGGYTGSGARAGGLDGKGGRLAMVHPDETVVDHSGPRRAAGLAPMSAPSGGGGAAASAGPVSINVNVAGARGNAEIRDMVESGVRQGLQEYDRSVLPRSLQKIRNDPRRIG